MVTTKIILLWIHFNYTYNKITNIGTLINALFNIYILLIFMYNKLIVYEIY